MWKLILSRLALGIPVLLVVSALTLMLVDLIPGDPAIAVVGPNGTEEQYEAVRQALGLNQPLIVRYFDWLGAAVTGDLGTSLFSTKSVAGEIAARLPVTLSLIAVTVIIAAVVGVGLGILAARFVGPIGTSADVLALIGFAVPPFWVGLLLAGFFAVTLRWFPAIGFVPITQSPSAWFMGLVLPAVTLAIPAIAVIAKQTRDALQDVLGRDFIRVLRANGMSNGSILYRHALKNAAVPIVTVLGVISVTLVGGTVVVETVFAMPGLGTLAVASTTQQDLNMVTGVVVVFAILVIAINLVVDLLYGLLNPKIRVS